MLPGLASLEVTLLQSLSRKSHAVTLLDSALRTGLRIPFASRNPVDLIRADRLSSDAVGIRAAVTRLLRAQDLIASADQGLLSAGAILQELDALLSEPAPIGFDLATQVSKLVDAYDGALRAAGSAQGERLLTGARSARIDGLDLNLAGGLRLLRAPKNPTSLSVEISAIGTTPQLDLVVPPAAVGQPLEIRVEGPLGAATINIPSASPAALAAAIEAEAVTTGVHASEVGGVVELTTPIAGSTSMIRVDPISGAANLVTGANGTSAFGSDAEARCLDGYVEARGNLLRVIRHGALVEIDVRAIGDLWLRTAGGGMLVNASTDPDSPFETRLGIPALLADLVGLDGLGSLAALRDGGALAPGVGDPVAARAVVRTVRESLERLRGDLADFENQVIDSARAPLESLLENLDAAEDHLRLVDLPQISLELIRARHDASNAQSAIEALFAQWSLLATLLPR